VRLLAIDPGPELSAWVRYDVGAGLPVDWGKEPNGRVMSVVRSWADQDAALAIEMIASYGMPVGAEVFETCVWIGRMEQHWRHTIADMTGRTTGADPVRVFRREVKLHLCGSPRAKDSHVRQALIDRYGPGRERAVGRKATPGPLYGMKADVWQALGVAITAAETRMGEVIAA
jgi:hypothetical protein